MYLVLEMVATKKKEQYEEQREKAIVEGFKKTLSGLQQFAGGAISASQSIYNSDSAFTAVIPTVQLLGDTVKNITSALASFTSGIPFFGSIFGGIDKVASAGIDITTKIIAVQLENSQRMLDIFNDITKTGMTFGGDLKHMTEVALSTGMDLKSFGKFVTGNIQSLAAMGGSVELSAIRIANMSKRVADSNNGLLAVYGTYDAMASATADFAATLTAAGLDTRNESVMNEAAVKQYLITQKELTAITGKSRDVAKKELDDKLKIAAYQSAYAKLDREQQANVQRNTAVFSMFSKEAGQAADELFATGQLRSKEGAFFRSQFPELAAAMEKLTEDAKTMNADQFNKTQGEYLKSVAPLLEQERKNKEHLFGLTYAVKGNAFLDTISGTSAGIGAMLPKINDLNAAVASQAQDTQRLNSDQSQVIGGLIASMADGKRQMDAATAGSIEKMATLAKTLIGINEELVKAFGTPDRINKMAVDFSKLIKDILNELNKDRSGGGANGVGTSGNNPTSDNSGGESPIITATRDNVTALNQNTEALGNNNTLFGGIATTFTNLMRRNEEGRPGGAPVSGPLTPASQPNPAPASAPSGPPVLKAPVKSGAGTFSPEVILALNAIYDKFGAQGMEVTSGQDPFHKNRKNSPHNSGLAADMKFRKGGTNYKLLEDQINQMLREKGIDATYETHFDEDKQGKKLQGKHGHVQVKPAQKKAEADILEQLVAVMTEVRDVSMETRDLNEDQLDTLDSLKRSLA